jgi:hypothetical protein
MEFVWLMQACDRHGLVHEAQWSLVYMLAETTAALMLFVLSRRQDPTTEESYAAATTAKGLLEKLAKNSVSARRCHDSISVCIPVYLPVSMLIKL